MLEVSPSNSTDFLREEGWFPVLIIGTFNLGDLIGRFIPFSEKAVLRNQLGLWMITLARYVICLPLIFMMAFDVRRTRYVL